MGVAGAAPFFTVTSSSFKDGARLPVEFGAVDPMRTCNPRTTEICPCPGKNVSPALSWSNAPAGTKSFAILMFDVDGRYGGGTSHWVAYNIPASTTSMAIGDATAGKGFTGGAGSRGNANYLGPCPPRGDGPHIYTFTVIATDLEPGALPAGLTREQFVAQAGEHMLGATTISGKYARSYD